MPKHKGRVLNLIRSAGMRVVAGAMFYSGAFNWIRRKRDRAAADWETKPEGYWFAVLLYHRVNPDNDPFFPAVSVKAFDAQMRFLAENYQVLSLGEIIERIRQGRGISPQTIAVTFDDGYRDNYLHAHPILRKYNLPATLFAATSYIGTEELMWNDRVALAMKLTAQQSITLPGAADSMSLRTATEKLRALEQILERLKTLPETEKQREVDEISGRLYNKAAKVTSQMLSWGELRNLANDGWEVGSHTANHVILTRMPLSEARREIASSSTILQHELDRPVRLFAYPNGKSGDYDSSIKKLLSEAGYVGAVTTLDRLNSQDTDLFEIGRRSPWEEPVPNFALKLDWSYWRRNRSLCENQPPANCRTEGPTSE